MFGTFIGAYVLIRTGKQNVHSIRDELVEIPGVRVVHPLLGADDLMCYIEAEDVAGFRDLLDHKVGILIDRGRLTHTETLPIFAQSGHGYSGDENRPADWAAWVLCTLRVGDPGPVVDKLLDIPGVVNAHPVLGRFDAVAYIEALTAPELIQILDENIRDIEEIVETDTRLVLMKWLRRTPHRNVSHQKPLGVKPPLL